MPPRKRTSSEPEDGNTRQDARPKRARRLKNISGLVDMPLDVWFEIFRLLSPLDLLHLARSTKLFRQTLMSRDTLTVWQHCREMLHPELPVPGEVMSEPAWINLIFDNKCHVCTTTIRRIIDWDLGIRLCPKCTPFSLLPMDEISEMYELIPVRSTSENTFREFRSRQVVFKPEMLQLANKFDAFETDDERLQFLLLCDRRLDLWNALAFEGKTWVDYEAFNHGNDLDQVRLDRKIQIYQKLAEEGYEAELTGGYDDDLSEHPFLKQNRPLTERTWQNKREELIELMEMCRGVRLEEERLGMVLSRNNRAVGILCLMMDDWNRRRIFTEPSESDSLFIAQLTPWDWADIPSIGDVILRPGDEAITEAELDKMFNDAPSHLVAWDAKAHEELRELHGLPSRAHLARAINVSICRSCAIPLFYPETLWHPCLTSTRNTHDGSLGNFMSLSTFGLHESDFVRRGWSAKEGLYVNKELRGIVREVVRVFGLDPDTALVKDMDALDFYADYAGPLRSVPHTYEFNPFRQYLSRLKMAFTSLHHQNSHRTLFGWRKLVLMLYYTITSEYLELEEGGLRIQQVPAASVGEMQTLETLPDPDVWICCECLYTISETLPSKLLVIQEHITAIHAKDAASQVENEDYVRVPMYPTTVAYNSILARRT